jgi:hypothetical protein
VGTGGKAGWVVKLTSRLHLVPRLRLYGVLTACFLPICVGYGDIFVYQFHISSDRLFFPSTHFVQISITSKRRLLVLWGEGGGESAVDHVPFLWKSAKPSELWENFWFHRWRVHFVLSSAVAVRTRVYMFRSLIDVMQRMNTVSILASRTNILYFRISNSHWLNILYRYAKIA